MFRTALTLLWVFGMMPVAALLGFPWTFISGKIDFLYWFALWIAGIGLRIAGVRVEVRGREHLDAAERYIFMCNHVSNLDPPVLVRELPSRTSVLVKRELFKVPLLGQAMPMADLVAVDRTNRESAVNSIHAAAEVLRRAHLHMTIFPEGTRSPDGRLLPFKKGPFYLALETGMSIVPVTILGTERMNPKGTLRIKPGTATLIFHPPISPIEINDRDALIAAVRESIASSLPADRGE